jgi:hypothetical protein
MEDLIPLMGMLMVFGLPIGGWITIRVLQHRERMAMLARGIVPPPDDRAWRRMQRRGGQAWTPPPWTAAGPAPVPPGYPVYDVQAAQCSLNKGIRTAMVGLALLIGLSFIGYHSGDGPFGTASIHPGPWLLGGLIPMFVGIAQIITALMAGAQFTLMRPQVPPPNSGPTQRTYGSGPSNGNAPPPPPYPSNSGPHYEELARPVKPPDVR